MAATRDAEVTAIEADLAEAATQPPFADAVARLAAYRGVGQLGALSLAAEVGDWRRFAHAGAFMAFTGLVPRERPPETASGGATSPAPAANIYGSSWWSRPGPIITVP